MNTDNAAAAVVANLGAKIAEAIEICRTLATILILNE